MKRLQLLLLMLLALPIGMLAAGTSWQTATLIENGGTGTGSLSGDVTKQWHKIVVPENGVIKLTVTPVTGLSLYYMTLYCVVGNDTHNRNSIYVGGSNQKTLEVNDVAAGTYYILTERSGGEGNFTIKYSFTATSSSYPNDKEVNDTYDKASELKLGTSTTGQLGYIYWDNRDTKDYHKIVVPENGTLKLTLAPHGELSIYYMTLYALKDGDLKNRNSIYFGSGDTKTLEVVDVAPGTYYILVERSGGQGGYTLTYNFSYQSALYPNDKEPNDTYDKATELNIGASTTGQLGYFYWDNRDTKDYHKIVVPENGTIQLKLTPQKDELSIYYMTLYALQDDDLKNRNSIYFGSSDEKTLEVIDVAPGTYYILIEHSGGQGGYTLTYNFSYQSALYPNDKEPNDTYDKATELKNGASTTGQLGYFYWDNRDTKDFHKIVVPENGTIQLKLTPQKDELDIYYMTLYALQDDNLKNRNSIYFGSSDEKTLEVVDVAPGTYYVLIERSGGQGGYTLSYKFSPLSAQYPNDKESNDTYDKASLVKRGNTITGQLGYYYWDNRDTKDYHKIEVPRNGTIKLTLAPKGELSIYYMTLYALKDGNLKNRNSIYFGSGDTKTLEVDDVAPGIYYILIERSGGQGGYTLQYKFEQNPYATDEEPNDTYDKAVSLEQDKTVAGHLGYSYYEDIDKKDWYKINLASKGDITLTAKPYGSLSFYYITLYASNGTTNKGSVYFGGSDQKQLKVENLDAGTYYVLVERGGGNGYYFLSYAASIGNVDKQDVLPDEEPDENPDDPDNPDNPDIDISGPDKDFIDDVGKDLLNQWDADSYRSTLGLLTQAMSYDTKEISQWGSEALKSMKTAITTPYDGISNGYMLMIRAANFTGHFRAIDNRWKYEGPADDLQFIFTDKAGTQCVARAVSSGNTKTVNIPYEFDIDEDDDDEGIKKQAKELVKDVKLIAVEVPEHFEITFTHGSTQLMLTTVDFDLSCFTEDWSPTTHGLIFSINSTFAKSGASTRGGTGTFEISMDRVGYQPGTGIKSSFIAKNDGNQIISFNLEALGTIKMEDGLIDINPETGVTIKDIGIESIKIDLDVMGRIQAHGSVSDVNTFVNTMINASNCKDEAEAQQIMSKLDGLIDGNFYYDNGTEAQGSLGLGLVYNEEKEEWKLEPTISFTSNNSTYPIKTYFSEKNFPEFVGGVQTILNELKEVATNLIQNVEKMNEEASGIENLPTDESSDAKAKIYTIGGRAVTSSSTLPSGVYIIKTPTGTRKFIKK